MENDNNLNSHHPTIEEDISKSQILPLNNLQKNVNKEKNNNDINSLHNSVSNITNDIKKKKSRKKLNVILTEDEEIYYYNLFQTLDEKNTGRLDAKQVATLMKKSGISRHKLKTIWLIASQTSIMYMERSEFYVVLRLIALAQNNLPCTSESIENNISVNILPFLNYKINGNNDKIIYKITENNKNMYKRLFDNNKDNNDSISARKAITIWKSTNVSDDIIRSVASIITPLKKKGFFNLKEFQVASYLFSISDKYEIPNKLPITLANFLEDENVNGNNNVSVASLNNSNNHFNVNENLINNIEDEKIGTKDECLNKLKIALQKANDLTKENENLEEKINSHKDKINELLKEMDDFQEEQKFIKEKLKYINQECTRLIDFINNKKENLIEEEKNVITNMKNILKVENLNNVSNKEEDITNKQENLITNKEEDNNKQENLNNISNKEEEDNNKQENLNNLSNKEEDNKQENLISNKEEKIDDRKENKNIIDDKEEKINGKEEKINIIDDKEEKINEKEEKNKNHLINEDENIDNTSNNKNIELRCNNNGNNQNIITDKKEFSFEECYENSNINDNIIINNENNNENKIKIVNNNNNMEKKFDIKRYNTSESNINSINTNTYNTNNFNDVVTNETNHQMYSQNYSDNKTINTNYSIPNFQYKLYWNNSVDNLKDPTNKMTESQRKAYQELEKKRNYFQNLFDIMSVQLNESNKNKNLNQIHNEHPNIYSNNNEIKCVQYNLLSSDYSNVSIHNIDATSKNKKVEGGKNYFENNQNNKKEELNSNLNNGVDDLFSEDTEEKKASNNEKVDSKEFDFDDKDYGFD